MNISDIKNSIELWKSGNNRAWPMLLSWEQIHWMIARIEELEPKIPIVVSQKMELLPGDIQLADGLIMRPCP